MKCRYTKSESYVKKTVKKEKNNTKYSAFIPIMYVINVINLFYIVELRRTL